MEKFKKVRESQVTISKLMLPSYSNFRGKIHGGYILSMLDEIAFACASRHSGTYCVTASVDTVNFLNPIEIGELVTMKASINFAGRTSMIVGIRVVSENIQTGEEKHCNSSYFTMVAKDENGNPDQVPGLILESEKDVRRYLRSIQMIEDRKNRKQYKERELSITVDELKDRLDSFKVKLNQEHLAGFLK